MGATAGSRLFCSEEMLVGQRVCVSVCQLVSCGPFSVGRWMHAASTVLCPEDLTRLEAFRVVEPSVSCKTNAVDEPGCLVALCAAAKAV